MKNQTIAKNQDYIRRLRQELAEYACPFQIGEKICKKEGYQAGTYKVIEILPCDNKEAYRMIGRKYSDVYGGLTLLTRELWSDLEKFVKVG